MLGLMIGCVSTTMSRRARRRPQLTLVGVLLLVTACGGSVPSALGQVASPRPSATAAHDARSAQDAVPTPGVTPPTWTPVSPPSASPAPPPVAGFRPTSPPWPRFTGASVGGCPTFPADNAWNTDISSAPVDPSSAAYIARIDSFSAFVHPDFGSDPSYGIPYVVVSGRQARVPVTFTAYGDESDPGPYPVPLDAPVEQGSDAHVLVVDSGDCHLYELYSAQRNANGWNAASGAVFDLRSNALRPDTWTSADAAGLPILPGLVRYDEVAAGVIRHALRFTVDETQNGFIHPATHQAGTSNPSDPPMGERFRLRASFDLTPFHGAALVILTALKRYGMMVADNGSSWFISGSTDSRWNDDDLNQLKAVPGSAFEAVQTGPIQRG